MGEMVIAAGNRRALQVRKPRRGGFSPRRQEAFLNVLAATCNVGLANKAAQVSVTTVYRARRRDPAFAARWQEALALAYERLETAMLARAMGTNSVAPDFDFADPEAILPEERIDTDLAIKMLARYRASGDGRVRAGARRKHVATEAETNAVLIRKLAVMRRQMEATTGTACIEHCADAAIAPEGNAGPAREDVHDDG